MAFGAHIFFEKFNCSTKCANCLVVMTHVVQYIECVGKSGGGEIAKSCSIIVTGKVSVLNFIFQY